ncbi:hypothetical protein ABZ656_32045 [Streptomyces sp. NPDC007095]|uniref:hypothetical protein n=1 Tax=Streptomyces sp. NPDC007095 TaxID=3154482 RepID=UPI0033F07159
MSARAEVHAALMRAGYGAPNAEALIVGIERDALTSGGEKDTRGVSPQQGESTHRHPRPCEFPTVLPCRCPVRPSSLPEVSFVRARHRARVAAFVHGARDGHAEVWSRAAS